MLLLSLILCHSNLDKHLLHVAWTQSEVVETTYRHMGMGSLTSCCVPLGTGISKRADCEQSRDAAFRDWDEIVGVQLECFAGVSSRPLNVNGT